MTDRGASRLPGLTEEEKTILLRFARDVLAAVVGQRPLPVCEVGSPALLRPTATFVTLRRRGTSELRGCRGESRAHRPLLESVRAMTIAAATDDPRFPPLRASELGDVKVEISALTPLVPIRAEQIVVGRHGLLIISGPDTGLLLPQVPIAWGWDREEYLTALCRKAGLADDAWAAGGAELYAFEANVWGEDDT